MIHDIYDDDHVRLWGARDAKFGAQIHATGHEIRIKLTIPKVGIELLDDATIKSCTSCGAPIVWGETANGKRCPFSVALLVKDKDGRWMMGTHFADCPNAGGHRKR